MEDAELLRYRHEFPILARSVYLNNCSLGALPRATLDALREFGLRWAAEGTEAWAHAWFPLQEEIRRRIAALIGAEAGEVALSPCVSTALATVASCLHEASPFAVGGGRRRHKVVVTALDFPTIAHQWLARRPLGVEVEVVPSDDGVTVDPERVAAAIDDRTLLVATSHVFYATGAVQDVRALAEAAHARGALLLVDGYHAVGVLPVDVRALDVDFYVAGTLKWLCGGPGLAFLYVRRELVPRLEPTATAWLAMREPFAFGLGLDFADDARRFEWGTPAVAALYAAREGLRIVAEAGPERIRARVARLGQRLVEAAQQRGWRVRSPLEPERRGGQVVLEVPRPRESVAELASRGVIVDYRPGCVRVSPHFYNTEDEIDAFVAELERAQRRLAG